MKSYAGNTLAIVTCGKDPMVPSDVESISSLHRAHTDLKLDAGKGYADALKRRVQKPGSGKEPGRLSTN